LVGESGSGKTTIGRTLLRLYEPTAGSIIYNGKDITKVQMQPYRRKMQYIFQDPYASLNPRMTVGDIIGEPIDIHNLAKDRNDRRERINSLLDEVGLNSEHATRYPHEFSGGQRQRIGIARALAVQPEFIVCDEPVSALDVSIQAQIINMLEKLQRDMGLTYLFIAHDLAVVKHISQRIGVMYLGKIVELTSTKELHANPLHPYTRALLSAIPVFDPKINKERKRIILEGEIPNPLNPPQGCVFSTRCAYAKDICHEQGPSLVEVGAGHHVACHFAGQI
jgi:oligopeptide transport system ATP-binding protein